MVQDSDQEAFGQGEGGVAAGPGRHLSRTTALAVQVGFSLLMAQDGQLIEELVPFSLRQTGQGGVGQPGSVVAVW
ncbi:hypothetical protein ACQP1W_32690 [Spirillospora sp. CA-255316]